MTEYTIGLLLPRSSLYPSIGMELVNGLKAGLQNNCSLPVRFVFDNIGFGAEEGEVYAKAEKLIYQENVSVVVVFMDHSASATLEALFEASNKLLIVLDPGAHLPMAFKRSRFKYTISLHAAICSRLTGYLAATDGAKRAVFATSFYESGYLSCFSYQRGYEVGGGQVFYHCVVPFHFEEFVISPLKESMNQIQPDAVLALFSTESGGIFLRQFAEAELHHHARMYASPFMLEENWLDALSFPFEGITGCTTWCRDLPEEMNRRFVDSLKEFPGTKPSVFSVLGWEASQFISIFLRHADLSGQQSAISEADLDSIQFNSPRGQVKINPATGFLFSPIYRAEIIRNEETGTSLLSLKEKISLSESDIEHFYFDGPQGTVSKWKNTYLCI